MFLALRDLRTAPARFALVAVVIALVALLGTLLGGLASGLVDDGISGLRAQSLTHLALQPKSNGQFSKSILGDEQFSHFEQLNDVDASRLGVSFFNAKGSRVNLDLALFGVDSNSFLIPNAEGRAALAKPNTIVISPELAADGAKVGDTLTLVGSDTELTVAGITHEGSYGHVPIAYASLETWQRALFGSASGRFSAIALRARNSAGEAEMKTAARASGLEVLTKEQAYDGSPGYAAETSTMTLIRGFLFVISGLIVGAFFTVWTIQRTSQIGLMKALGASNGYVLRDSLGQLLLILVVAITAGTAVGYALGLAVPDAVPFAMKPLSVIASSALLLLFGILGAGVALRRITKVDPVIALSASL
jgi:putative ABC transport system permease protein